MPSTARPPPPLTRWSCSVSRLLLKIPVKGDRALAAGAACSREAPAAVVSSAGGGAGMTRVVCWAAHGSAAAHITVAAAAADKARKPNRDAKEVIAMDDLLNVVAALGPP